MLAIILGGLAIVLWILGGRMAADWIPFLEREFERELYLEEKLRLVVAWPVVALLNIFSSDKDEDDE